MLHTDDRLKSVIKATFDYSRSQGWRGYNKHDGLNSPLLRFLLGFSKWPRIVAIQGVMRFPVNLRPLLGVPKTYNPKGLALFCLALLDSYEALGEQQYLEEAEQLLSLLLELQSPGEWPGIAWGYHYPWQDPGFFAPTNTPNAVVTSFVCEAFLRAYRVTGKQQYLDTVASSAQFFCDALVVLKDQPDELCVSYMPLPMSMRVMDVSILIAAVLAQLDELSSSDQYANQARRLCHYVMERQTDEGAWFYTDPPGDSHITHDNYHTGFILDALWRYMEATGDRCYEDNYWRGLDFYAQKLFTPDGAPRWMSDKAYPYDIHGAAQGILTFSRHQDDRYSGLADRILKWALNNMYHPDGRFFYQQGKYYTRRFTLLRWSNGWMLRGMAALLKESGDKNDRK